MLISQYTRTREISIYQVQWNIYEIFSDLLDALCFKKLSNRTARQLCFTGHIIFGCNIRYKPLSYLLKPKTDRKNAIRKKHKANLFFAFCFLLFCFSPDFCFFCRDWRSLSLGCFLFSSELFVFVSNEKNAATTIVVCFTGATKDALCFRESFWVLLEKATNKKHKKIHINKRASVCSHS